MSCSYLFPLTITRESESSHRIKIAEAILILDEQFPRIDSAALYRQVYDIESVSVSGENFPFKHKDKHYRVRIAYNERTTKAEEFFVEC